MSDVSSDFIGTTHPTIVDYNSTFQIDRNSIKFTLWYDNEFSYAASMLNNIKHMHKRNNKTSLNKVENVYCHNQVVIVRCDFNCPVTNGKIDDYRIQCAIPTLNKILLDKPRKLILVSHFGRPKQFDKKFSTQIFVERLEHYLKGQNIEFLPNANP